MGRFLLALLLAGCTAEPLVKGGVLAPFRDADTLELFALSPDRPSIPVEHRIDAWRSLGSATIEARTEREALIDALEGAIASGHELAACFEPRHGLRAKKGEHIAETVICFECRQAYVALDGAAQHHAIGVAAQQIFDEALARHGLPKAP